MKLKVILLIHVFVMEQEVNQMANGMLDMEWTKFMTRLNRQQNCDDNDIDDDYDDDECNEVIPSAISHVTPAGAGAGMGMGGTGGTGAGGKLKKSCISKKSQRRTYSFIDTISDEVDDASSGRLMPSMDAEMRPDIDATAPAAAPPLPLPPTMMRFTPIYISTKTKIAYLNKKVDIYDAFWKIPIQHYYKRREGVIKKQIKFQTTDPAVVASIKEKLEQQPRHYEEHIIEHIDNPNGRIPYKDQRKVSIGLCKKDLLGGNHKKKRAFFNCFVVILRINGGIAPPEERAPEDDILYKEMHVKVFNTGKLEIPGVQEDNTLVQVLQLLVKILRPILGDDLAYMKSRCETALINSNFNCGFYIDRDKLFHLLKYKYRMNCNYDSCSYPGIQSKFYYIPDATTTTTTTMVQTGQQPVSMDMPYYEVSFMIFRTGSILIVGKCNEEILGVIYQFICRVLETEYSTIQMGAIPSMATGDCGGGGGAEGVGSTRISRKKKIHTTNIRRYEDSDADADADADADLGK